MTFHLPSRVSITVEASDDDLVERAVSGSVTAFESLVDRYYRRCLRFAVRQLGSREDAEEAVQDAFVRAYRSLGNGGRPQRFRPWLMAIVVNRCRTYRAKNRTRRALIQRLSIGAAVRRAAPPERIDGDDLSPALAHALSRLSPGLREAFLLKHVEELTYEAMANATGIRISALKMRVKRAGERLARELESAE